MKSKPWLPINDTIIAAIAAIAQLIDDSKSNGEYRDPTHSDIEFYVGQAGLSPFDPKRQGQPVGKAKRVRVISWIQSIESWYIAYTTVRSNT